MLDFASQILVVQGQLAWHFWGRTAGSFAFARLDLCCMEEQVRANAAPHDLLESGLAGTFCSSVALALGDALSSGCTLP